MASAVIHTDKTTTPLTYHYPITLLFTFVFTPYKKLFCLLYFTPYKSGLIIFNTITSKPIFM